jgi:predicted DNA-binding transcriptional regulator AlpA
MEETSQLLGISRATLWILAKQGDFPLFHIQKRVFVRVKSLLEWIRMKEHPEAERSTTVMASQKNYGGNLFRKSFPQKSPTSH